MRSLIVGLPFDDAATWREEKRKRGWTTTEELLALVASETRLVARLVHASTPHKPGRYKPIPQLQLRRPGESRRPNVVSPAALARALTGRQN